MDYAMITFKCLFFFLIDTKVGIHSCSWVWSKIGGRSVQGSTFHQLRHCHGSLLTKKSSWMCLYHQKCESSSDTI